MMPNSQNPNRPRDSQLPESGIPHSDLERYINDKLDESRKKTREHFDVRLDELRDILLSAFPDGVEKHHEYHKSLITASEDRKKFWTGIKEKLTLGVIGSVLIFIYTAVVEALKHEVKK